jgi:hypothetical protein
MSMAKKAKAKKRDEIPDVDGAEFDALSDQDKEKVYRYFDTHPRLKGRKPSKKEQERIDVQVAAEKKRRGRPTMGEGCTQIGVTIETGLLRRVDEYARSHNLKRAQLITQGLLVIIGT